MTIHGDTPTHVDGAAGSVGCVRVACIEMMGKMRAEVLTMSYRMRQVPPSLNLESFLPLSFPAQLRPHAGQMCEVDAVLAGTVGAQLEYGPLAAYLLRRFGWPNRDWDGDSELARYVLTAPRDDLVLCVVPRLDGLTRLGVRFLVPAAVARCAARAQRRQARGLRPALWTDAAPLKPYAMAAIQALEGLKRPVRVGEGAVDIFGSVVASKRCVAAHVLSGRAHREAAD